MTSYEELFKTNRAPPLKDLVLSLTWTHDPLLINPDVIRKFFYTKCHNTMHYAKSEDFLDEDDMGIAHDHSNANDIYKALVDDQWMMFYGIDHRGPAGNTSCCTREDHLYARFEIDRDNNKIKIISKLVPVNKCSDYGGGTHFKMPKPCVIENLTFKKFLMLNPKCIEDLDLEQDLALILKELD